MPKLLRPQVFAMIAACVIAAAWFWADLSFRWPDGEVFPQPSPANAAPSAVAVQIPLQLPLEASEDGKDSSRERSEAIRPSGQNETASPRSEQWSSLASAARGATVRSDVEITREMNTISNKIADDLKRLEQARADGVDPRRIQDVSSIARILFERQ
jgi:hypothetical protein